MSVYPYSTQRWQRLRRLKLRTNPLCEACLQIGSIEPAVAVDHCKPISREGRQQRRVAEAFPALEQLASLCEGCHNRKTRGEQLGREFTPKVVHGCDVHGRPLNDFAQD
jgi:5-methylcytosine-specific restriction endonuclease McrA